MSTIVLTDNMVNWMGGLPGHPARAVVVFHSPGCPHCVRYVPVVRQLAPKYRGRATFYSIDVSQNPMMASKFATEGVPVTVLFGNGQPVGRQVGALDAAGLVALLTPFIGPPGR